MISTRTEVRAAFSSFCPPPIHLILNFLPLQDGVHKAENEDAKVPVEVRQMMKSQDLRYVASKNQLEKAKIERLKSTHHLVGKPAKSEKEQHIVFVDEPEEGTDRPSLSSALPCLC